MVIISIIQQPDWIKDINNIPYILPAISVLVIIFFLVFIFRDKFRGKEKVSKAAKKKGIKSKTEYEIKFEKDLGDELRKGSTANEYKFIQSLYKWCKSINSKGETFTEEQLTNKIVRFYSKYSSERVSQSLGTYMTIGQFIGSWINLVEKDNKIKFKGTESFEQYNSLAKKIYNVLTNDMLQRALSGRSFK